MGLNGDLLILVLTAPLYNSLTPGFTKFYKACMPDFVPDYFGRQPSGFPAPIQMLHAPGRFGFLILVVGNAFLMLHHDIHPFFKFFFYSVAVYEPSVEETK